VATHDDPILVTTAPMSPGEERRGRERRYLITMGVRVIAFIVALIFATGWIRVIAVGLALILPWVGVVMANAGPSHEKTENPSLYTGGGPHELE
jgi:Protein of unknown function (DUF3099)